ncbi:MAG: DMT family transporter [Pseudomonadota bacterium]
MTTNDGGVGRLRSEYAIGMILLVASAVTYSTAGVFTKGVEAGAWTVIFWRGVFAALATAAWAASRCSLRQEFFEMGWAGLAVGVIGAAGTAAFISAFKLTSIANVALIYAVAPLLAALLAWLTIGERVTRRTALGTAGSIVGVAIIVAGSVGSVNLVGDGLALVMTVAMAGIMVLYRARPDTPSAGPSVLQSLLLFPFAIALGSPFQAQFDEIAILAAFGILFAIASVTLAEGAKRIPSSQTALLGALETPLAPLLALLILVEVPSVATLIGGAIVLVAVLASMRKHSAS